MRPTSYTPMFRAGYAAYQFGGSCPYSEGTFGYEEWHEGWRFAAERERALNAPIAKK